MLCGYDQVPLHVYTQHGVSSLSPPPTYTLGEGEGHTLHAQSNYSPHLPTHQLPTPHTHHTSPLTTPPQWPHPPLTTPPHFPCPTDPPPTHWWVVASGLSSKKDGSAHFLGSVMTRSCIWCVSHAWMTQLLCTRTWLERLAITGEEVLLCYLAREHYLHGKQPIL